MKTGTAIFLAFAIWFGWTQWTAHEAKNKAESDYRWHLVYQCEQNSTAAIGSPDTCMSLLRPEDHR